MSEYAPSGSAMAHYLARNAQQDALTTFLADDMGMEYHDAHLLAAEITLSGWFDGVREEAKAEARKLPTRDEIAEAIEGGIFDRPTALTWRGDAESGEHWIESPIREVADQGADAVLELLKGEGRD